MAMTAEEGKKPEKEGANLLGRPKFKKLPNGRFRCVETGHELLDKDKDFYSKSKRCRLGLIDYAVANSKPPLNMFIQDPKSRSKLICKLTGDSVNKSEEHIWKHINGKRFLNKLETEEEKQEEGKPMDELGEETFEIVSNGQGDGASKKKKKDKKKKDKKKKNKEGKGKEKITDEINSEETEAQKKNSNSDDEDFWMPPVGERWDFDDGKDRWGSDGDSGMEDDEGEGEEVEKEEVKEEGTDDPQEDASKTPEEISTKKKRKSVEIGADSSVSRKKKKKKNKKAAKNISKS